MRIRFHERVLHGVFRVFAVARDVHGKSKYFALVAIYQLFKSGRVATFRGSDEQVLVFAGDGRRQSMWIGRAQGRRLYQVCEEPGLDAVHGESSTIQRTPLNSHTWMT